MSSVPTPRFDLLKMRHYAFGSLQFSRGCPFQCEFCDIIVTFGRRPRIKSAKQVIAELEALRATGLKTAFIVDDNLIGNKKAIKEVLREVVVWQKQHGYPFITVHRGIHRPRRRRGTHAAHDRGELHRRLHRH